MKGAIRESVADEHKTYYEQKEIDKYLFDRTKVAHEIKEPCQAVVNLLRVMEKLLRKGKGARIPKNRLYRTRCSKGIPSERCVEVLIRTGFLSEIGDSVKVKVDGFDTMRSFMRGPTAATMSEKIQKALDALCPDVAVGCKHVYRE
jgi:hypothetical protein